MEETRYGWVIANFNHPRSSEKRIYPETFRRTRKECISEFIKGSGYTWKSWKSNYNFVVVKAEMTVRIEQH